MQREVVSDAVLAALGEHGPLRAGELARMTAAGLGLEAPAVRDIKAEVWRLVDERRCLWNLDRLIELPEVPRDVAAR